MNRTSPKTLLAFAACGLAGSMASVAVAQSGQYNARSVNVSGATLQQNFFTAAASTNDFIDVDGNLTSGSLGSLSIQQLAPAGIPNPPTATASLNGYWAVIYRSTGSVTGLQELIDFGRTPASTAAQIPALNATDAYYNRTAFITGGALGTGNNNANPGNNPIRANAVSFSTDATNAFRVLWTPAGTASTSPNVTPTGVTRIDVAALDVPASWAVQNTTGTPSASDLPNTPGYGTNPNGTRNFDGSINGFSNKLATLGTATLYSTPAAANANTLFDTLFAWAPIAVVANFGTGITQIPQTELRHLFITGRTFSGENLIAVTRDAGSGTRNAWTNSLGVDPSYGVGENVGGFTTSSAANLVGPALIPSNKSSSGNMEATVFNLRLAIGYAGAERGINNNWLGTGTNNDTNPLADIPSVIFDIGGGNAPVRPYAANVIDLANANSWRIGGPASLVTFGDPLNAPASAGGVNWPQYNWDRDGRPTRPSAVDCPECNDPQNPAYSDYKDATRPAAEAARPTSLTLANPYAAALINNVTRSTDAFVRIAGSDQNNFMPGELLAFNFVATAATSALPVNNPTVFEARTQNASLRNYLLNLAGNQFVYNRSRYSFFIQGANSAGRLPQRTVLTGGNRYSNGLSDANTYTLQNGGGTVTGSSGRVPLRSKIAGDFNGDGLRDIRDAAELVRAWRERNGGPAWVAPAGAPDAANSVANAPGTGASIELLGDFNGDGNFGRIWNNTTGAYAADYADVRYWADGLAIDNITGKLRRYAGFQALDNAWQDQGGTLPFIPTVLATGKAYAAGDAAGDLIGANPARRAKNWAPTSSDGRVDANDIDYLYAQFKNNALSAQLGVVVTDGEATWSDINEAATFDLSADLNGDLVVNQADVCLLVSSILGTCVGDVNLDGVVNSTDLAIAQSNLGQAGGWAKGDMNGDGFVTEDDINLILGLTILCCNTDYNRDGFLNLDDLGDFITDFYTLPPIPGGLQVDAPTYSDAAIGFTAVCAFAPDAPAPFAANAYRVNGFRVAYSADGSNACPLDPGQPFPNLDNLNDYITAYYGPECRCYQN